MVYSRWASGFRAGGPNFFVPGTPTSYAPDRTQNYEVGLKGDLLKGALSLDASLYYIDWQNLQLSLRSQGFTYFTNGGHAKSEGVEFSVTARPFPGLVATGWMAHNNAVLTEPFPAGSTAYGVSGDRLPNSARNSAHLSVDQHFPLWAGTIGFIGGAVTYTGDRLSVFTSTPIRQDFPAYTRVDLRAGMQKGTWSTNVYIDNLTDTRGVIAGGISYQPDYAFVYTRPRTVGLNITKAF